MLLLVLGMRSIVSYEIVGVTVETQNYPRKPFALIPLGCFFILLGIVVLLIGTVRICPGKFKS